MDLPLSNLKCILHVNKSFIVQFYCSCILQKALYAFALKQPVKWIQSQTKRVD